MQRERVLLDVKGDELLRVTGRKDKYGELEEFICNDCRFDAKGAHETGL